MKKYLMLITTLIVITMSLGCKDENAIVDPAGETNYAELVTGSWKFFTLTYVDGDSSVTFTAEEAKVWITFVFRNDNSATIMQLNQDKMNITNCNWYATTDQIVLQYKNEEEEFIKYRCEKDKLLSLQYPFRKPNGQTTQAWFNFEKVITNE